MRIPQAAWPLAALLASCATPPPTAAPAPAPPVAPAPTSSPAPAAAHEEPRVHLEGSWVALRAARLGLDPALAAERDRGFEVAPPEDGLWWDEQLAREVWGIWTDLCMECHDGARSLKKVMSLPPPSRGWAQRDALFFAKQLAPRDVFRTIADGAKAKRKEDKDMPAWKKRISNEQMWGLVYFIGAASKKKDSDLH